MSHFHPLEVVDREKQLQKIDFLTFFKEDDLQWKWALTLEALIFFKPLETKGFFSIWNHHNFLR